MSARSRIGIGIGMCAMVSLLGGNAVFAQEAQCESRWCRRMRSPSGRPWALRSPGPWMYPIHQNFNNPNNNINQSAHLRHTGQLVHAEYGADRIRKAGQCVRQWL